METPKHTPGLDIHSRGVYTVVHENIHLQQMRMDWRSKWPASLPCVLSGQREGLATSQPGKGQSPETPIRRAISLVATGRVQPTSAPEAEQGHYAKGEEKTNSMARRRRCYSGPASSYFPERHGAVCVLRGRCAGRAILSNRPARLRPYTCEEQRRQPYRQQYRGLLCRLQRSEIRPLARAAMALAEKEA